MRIQEGVEPVTPDNFRRIIQAMAPPRDPNTAEEHLVHWMSRNRADDNTENREELLNAGGAFYAVYSVRAVECGKPQAHDLLFNAWVDMGIEYDRGAKGADFADMAFEMYRVIVTHRI